MSEAKNLRFQRNLSTLWHPGSSCWWLLWFIDLADLVSFSQGPCNRDLFLGRRYYYLAFFSSGLCKAKITQDMAQKYGSGMFRTFHFRVLKFPSDPSKNRRWQRQKTSKDTSSKPSPGRSLTNHNQVTYVRIPISKNHPVFTPLDLSLGCNLKMSPITSFSKTSHGLSPRTWTFTWMTNNNKVVVPRR